MTPVARELAAALRRTPGASARLVGWMAVAAAPALVHGYAVAHALDDGFLAGRRDVGLAWLGVLTVAVAVGALGAGRAMLAAGAVAEPFRDHLVASVVRSTLRRSTEAGRPADATGVARLSQQVETVRMALGSTALVVLGFVASVGVALLGIGKLSTDVLVLVVPPIALAVLGFAASLPAVARRERALVLGGELVAADLNNVMAGLRDLRAAGAGDVARTAVGRDVEAQAAAARAVARMTGLRLLAVGVGGRLPVVLILLGAPWLIRAGTPPGVVVGSLVYVLTAVTPSVSSLAEGLGTHGVKLWVTLGRLLEAEAEAEAGSARPRPPTGDRPRGALAADARGLWFAYGPHAEPVVAGLDLALAPGERLAVVGPSGIGKSTLAGLLCGTLTPDAGTVCVGGRDVGAADPAARALLRVLIPQEAYVFAGTLRDNLAYLRPRTDGPEEENAAFDSAAAAVGSAELCARLGGYDAPLDPGTLSAGERQLLALTRAYLSPAPFAVLDEATCHLDPVAEARAEDAFAARGTVLVVAHRITSALRADRVLVLDGTRATAGTHTELLGASALYRDLVGQWETDAAA